MHPKLAQWILNNGVFAGVECVQKKGELCYHLCVVEKEKEAAKIVQQKRAIPTLKKLKALIGEDVPIFLTVNVKGILHRKLDYLSLNSRDTLKAVFPSVNVEDFLVQQVPVNQKTFVSVIRKEVLEDIVHTFVSTGLWVVNVFAGSFLLEHILTILPATNEIQTSQLILTTEEGHLQGFVKSNTVAQRTFQIGEDDVVHEENLLSLCMAFMAIMNPTIQGLPVEQVTIQKEAFLYKKAFQYVSVGALSVFFIALLINYFLFDTYYKKEQDLKVELAQQQNLLSQLDTLKRQLESKKALLGAHWNLGKSKASFYADRLAASLPSSIKLTSLVLFPKVQEKNYSDEDKFPRYHNRKIIIKGQCQASVFYNNWKHNIQDFDWVESLHNLSYQNGNKGVGLFELEITLKL